MTDTKVCANCGAEKPYSEFYKDARTKQDGLMGSCKICHQIRCLDWGGGRNLEARKAYQSDWHTKYYHNARLRLRRYHLTLEQFLFLIEKQNNSCGICYRPFLEHESRIDHDHDCCPIDGKSCGKCVRGLLCEFCNRTIVPWFERFPHTQSGPIKEYLTYQPFR